MNMIDELILRMADSANAARAHYQIWFTLRGEGKALPDYYSVMNDHRYVDFFHAINSGNYKLMYIELGCLFDTDSRAASFRNLKIELKNKGQENLVADIDKQLKPFNMLVSNILTIRAKLMAHKELGVDSEEVHRKNGVVPNDIGKLIDVCSDLINKTACEITGNNISLIAAVSNRFEEATFDLLKVLRRGRS
ncbi:MAG: hypothetical protein HPY82_18845 [Gammaproteobacteria bacterium]|nr:hypothetical protein [Gammaproteobacteria bacterium]